MPFQRPIYRITVAAAAALWISAGAVAATPASTPAATASAAPVSPAKKALVAQVLKLQQPGIDNLARNIAQQPAMQLLQQANGPLQQLPAERREAVARDIEADARKFVDEVTPIVRSHATKLMPTTVGSVLETRFSEDELRQIIAILESPTYRKFQSLDGEMQRSLAEKLMPEIRDDVGTKLRALQQATIKRLAPPASAPASGPSAAKK